MGPEKWLSVPTVKPNSTRWILSWPGQRRPLANSSLIANASSSSSSSSSLNKGDEVNVNSTALMEESLKNQVILTDLLPSTSESTHPSTSPSTASSSQPVNQTMNEQVPLHQDPLMPYNTTTAASRPISRLSTTRKPSSTTTSTSTASNRDEWLDQMHLPTTAKPYDAKRDCGSRSLGQERQGRVVGGRDSQLGEFPWSVLIRETTLLGFFVKTKCGGVLIDLKWVLTAAHCQPGMFGSLVVVVGEYDLAGRANNKLNKPILRKVKRMIIHRDYNPSNFDNDIALLELETPYQLQPNVVPICLPEKDEDFIGRPAMVAGWGKLSFGGPVPSVLQVAKLPVIDNKQCQSMYYNSGHIKIISDSFLCAGYANGGHDSCEGDSGGPLQVQRTDSKWVLVGTVSHGIKCAEPNLPGIYIRTAAYLPWIKAVTYHQDHNKRYGHRLRH